MENQKLQYQLNGLKTSYNSLRKKYQELSAQLNEYHRKSIENKEYRDQYDVLLKQVQNTQREKENETRKDNPQQPSLQQGPDYRQQYLSYGNEIPPNT